MEASPNRMVTSCRYRILHGWIQPSEMSRLQESNEFACCKFNRHTSFDGAVG
jgi:hypothetical protein